MGGADIDLNDAELTDDNVQMTVFSLMGGADVRVPEGLNVEVSEFAFMGGNGVKLGETRPDPGGPTLHIRVISIMGGTDVTARAQAHPRRAQAPEAPRARTLRARGARARAGRAAR